MKNLNYWNATKENNKSVNGNNSYKRKHYLQEYEIEATLEGSKRQKTEFWCESKSEREKKSFPESNFKERTCTYSFLICIYFSTFFRNSKEKPLLTIQILP